MNPSGIGLSTASFKVFPQCPATTQVPTLSNGEYVLPEPSIVPSSCSWALNDVDEIGSQQQSGFSFTGTFQADGHSGYSFDEEVVTAVDDNVNWTGQEYGFRMSFANGTVFGYVQDGTKLANGYTYFYSVPLIQADGKVHNFKAVETTLNGTENVVDYYVDGVLKGTITRVSPANYSAQYYHLILTTHRWENGWDSGDSNMTVYNISVIG